MNVEILLRLDRISKSFAGVSALCDVSLEVAQGEIHALVGENGAGKSTLMNIVSGVLPPDSGAIYWDGQQANLRTPRDAQNLGISFVHQELALVPQLSIAENVFLGVHPATNGWVRWNEMNDRARALMAELGHALDPRILVEDLSIGEQQLVEIARALACNSRLIIMDEPTAPLSERETGRLFEVMMRLRERGVSIIYITHRLKEIYIGPDRVTVLRDGRHVATAPIAEMPVEVMVHHMIGRSLEDQLPERVSHARPEVALEVRNFRGLNFQVHSGEIVALAGLVGAGRSEVIEALFGMTDETAGQVFVDGREVKIHKPEDAIRHGLALVPDDRKAKGLMLGASIRCNMAITYQREFVLKPELERAAVQRMIGDLRVRTSGSEQAVAQLSGGNQQKVVIAKWLLAKTRIFLLDEPTRGVDVGAKAEIYALIRKLAQEGCAILFASSELDEVRRLADRILVMHRGAIAGELPHPEATDDRIMHLATGGEA